MLKSTTCKTYREISELCEREKKSEEKNWVLCFLRSPETPISSPKLEINTLTKAWNILLNSLCLMGWETRYFEEARKFDEIFYFCSFLGIFKVICIK